MKDILQFILPQCVLETWPGQPSEASDRASQEDGEFNQRILYSYSPPSYSRKSLCFSNKIASLAYDTFILLISHFVALRTIF